VVRAIRGTPRETLGRMGETAREVLNAEVSQAILCGRFCDALDRVFRRTIRPKRVAAEPVGGAERNVSCAR
jgi:hypothetical protein